jgi:hypothetical protein
MIIQLTLMAPLIGLAALFGCAARRDPDGRARKEAEWRDMILAAGLSER